MTPKEFQELHGFTDEDMEKIRMICLLFNGRVMKIESKK